LTSKNITMWEKVSKITSDICWIDSLKDFDFLFVRYEACGTCITLTSVIVTHLMGSLRLCRTITMLRAGNDQRKFKEGVPIVFAAANMSLGSMRLFSIAHHVRARTFKFSILTLFHHGTLLLSFHAPNHSRYPSATLLPHSHKLLPHPSKLQKSP